MLQASNAILNEHDVFEQEPHRRSKRQSLLGSPYRWNQGVVSAGAVVTQSEPQFPGPGIIPSERTQLTIRGCFKTATSRAHEPHHGNDERTGKNITSRNRIIIVVSVPVRGCLLAGTDEAA